MKYFAFFALPIVLSASIAHATTINGQFSMTGMSVYDDGTSLTFTSDVVHVGDASTLYGSFQTLLTPDETGQISSPVNYQDYTPNSASVVFTNDSSSLTFVLQSISIVNNGDFRNFVGTGVVTTTFPGYDQQTANLLFTTQGNGSVTFSATAVAPAGTQPTETPEPSSLALLGSGLLGASGFMRGRFQRVRVA